MSSSGTQSGRFVVSTLIFLGVASALSLHCYRASILGIDVLGYAELVSLHDTGDVVQTHKIIYSHPLTPHLRGTDEDSPQARDMRLRAADPYLAATHLPYFAIKPLYVSTLTLVHGLGFGAIDSVRFVSALFFLGIAIMVWVYTQSWLSLIVMIIPEIILLGQMQEPDAMSCFLQLLGLWLVFFKRVDIGLLVFLVAIWVRPENALLSVLVTFSMLILGRLDWRKAAVLILLSFGSIYVINHYGYPWNEVYGHFLGAAPGRGAASPFSSYRSSLAKSAIGALHSSAPLFLLIWLACFRAMRREMRWAMGVTLVYSALRFVMFPGYEPRYYGLFFVISAMAAVLLVRIAKRQDLAGESTRSC